MMEINEKILGLDERLIMLLEKGVKDNDLYKEYVKELSPEVRVAAELELGKNNIKNQIKDFLERREENPEDSKIEILLPLSDKLISEFASELGKFFSDKTCLFFRPSERGVVCLENSSELSFQMVKRDMFVSYIENYFIPGVYTKNKKTDEYQFKKKSMSGTISDVTLASGHFRNKLPVIERLVSSPMPILKGNKLTFPKRGYDKELLTWMPYEAPEINPKMSLEDAKKLLEKIYKEFCWKDNEQDKCNAIAGLLSPLIRGLLPRITCRMPIFFYKANRERAGKDYCAGITGIVYYGIANDDPPISDGKNTHDEEFRKRVLSAFKAGKNRMHISNNKGYINSAQLEGVSTSENWTDRQLGTNIELTFPNILDLSLSANTGITYTPDLSNRCVFVNLFLSVEDPNKRYFDNPYLHGWVKEHRCEILSALYTLVRNWHEKGMPGGSLPFSSFPEWAKVCGGIMEAAGLGNPCVPNDDAASIGGDNETRDMKCLFELCYEEFQDKWIFKREIMDILKNADMESPFNELFAWIDWNESGSRRKFGILFEKYIGREFSGLILRRLDAGSHTERRKYQWSKVQKQLIIDKNQKILGEMG